VFVCVFSCTVCLLDCEVVFFSVCCIWELCVCYVLLVAREGPGFGERYVLSLCFCESLPD